MNQVTLTGVVRTQPQLYFTQSGIPHTHFLLSVMHRTAAGQLKREEYPVQAWRSHARFACEWLQKGMYAGVCGYLTLNRDRTPEVVAEEFLGVPVQRSAPASPAPFCEAGPSPEADPTE